MVLLLGNPLYLYYSPSQYALNSHFSTLIEELRQSIMESIIPNHSIPLIQQLYFQSDEFVYYHLHNIINKYINFLNVINLLIFLIINSHQSINLNYSNILFHLTLNNLKTENRVKSTARRTFFHIFFSGVNC